VPKDPSLRRVLVLGSGPIVIGQAAEFDYAGTQACRALAEEGVEVVLVNSNPATIMTDPSMADRVYLEPLTPEVVAEIIRRERPDGLLPTLAGQVGLNLARALARSGVLAETGVRLLGTPLEAIERAEDRELFRSLMLELGEPIPASQVVTSVSEGLRFAAEVGYPLIVRPAYTLGGTGGGFARDGEELEAVLSRGLAQSPIGQCLVEASIAGYQELEYEVMRDAADNAITVCNMENIDPVGVHTGDSIVVAPSLTLTDDQYHRLREASLRIIRALGVNGGCNIQFGLDPEHDRYMVIEVNPRVSRSSALASKATGYPIAKIAAKLALGYTLPELPNPVTGETSACFEPALDYVVVKIPRWPFDKFPRADRRLGTQMKATGEVMAIGRTFRQALQKAARALEVGADGLSLPQVEALPDAELDALTRVPDDRRLFALAAALRRGTSVADLAAQTRIAPYFLEEMARVVRLEMELPAFGAVDAPTLRRLKAEGFSDRRLARLWQVTEEEVRERRWRLGIRPVYKMVDTCAGEFAAKTPYFYGTYEEENEAETLPGEKILIIGSGPIRIGQGIEFDCSSVHALRELRSRGTKVVMVNCNPETVSTDFTESDRLYFEPLTLEDVLEVARREEVDGILVQFGGQTAINLAAGLAAAGERVLGTSVTDIERAEDRELFDRALAELGLPRPRGLTALNREEARRAAEQVGYPVLVRPSFVLGGRAMEVVRSEEELEEYLADAVEAVPGRPILIDQYVEGLEVETDAVADGRETLVVGVMEHVERAGVHSGDSIAAYPAPSLTPEVKARIVAMTEEIAARLAVRGLINIQFVVMAGEVYVLEANPRASRTVPFLEKVTGLPVAGMAAAVMAGATLRELGFEGGLFPEPDHYGVKAPVFSWAKLARVDAYLSPEMKSTGEVLGLDRTYEAALLKAFWAAGYRPQRGSGILLTVADRDKREVLPLAAALAARGYHLFATAGTAEHLRRQGIAVEEVRKIGEARPNILDLIEERRVDLVVNTLTRGRDVQSDGFRIRREAVEHAIPCLTSLDTARALLRALGGTDEPKPVCLQDEVAAVLLSRQEAR
jgi:carbamoyl-phosphate synthase large subunit